MLGVLPLQLLIAELQQAAGSLLDETLADRISDKINTLKVQLSK
jgi:hypothetical protein